MICAYCDKEIEGEVGYLDGYPAHDTCMQEEVDYRARQE